MLKFTYTLEDVPLNPKEVDFRRIITTTSRKNHFD